jgi:hypothetical protein
VLWTTNYFVPSRNQRFMGTANLGMRTRLNGDMTASGTRILQNVAASGGLYTTYEAVSWASVTIVIARPRSERRCRGHAGSSCDVELRDDRNYQLRDQFFGNLKIRSRRRSSTGRPC